LARDPAYKEWSASGAPAVGQRTRRLLVLAALGLRAAGLAVDWLLVRQAQQQGLEKRPALRRMAGSCWRWISL
jgi:hypothetical protein